MGGIDNDSWDNYWWPRILETCAEFEREQAERHRKRLDMWCVVAYWVILVMVFVSLIGIAYCVKEMEPKQSSHSGPQVPYT